MKRHLQYLLDTDMCIYLLNGNQQVKDHVSQVGIETIGVALPTVGELYFGAYNSNRIEANLARVRTFLADPGPALLPLDDPVLETSVVLRLLCVSVVNR